MCTRSSGPIFYGRRSGPLINIEMCPKDGDLEESQ